MRIAVAGGSQMAFSLLAPLIESSRHEVVALVQNGRRTKGAKRRLLPWYAGLLGGSTTVFGLGNRYGIPVIWIDRMADDLDPLRALAPDVLVVGGFDIILKRPLLELPRLGCVNAHSSLLPKHRGANPFSWVILVNERETGVTFHLIDEGIDTGDILDQTAFRIEPEDTATTLYLKACDVIADRVVAVMDRIEDEGLRGVPQDHSAASYDPKPLKEDAVIDWTLSAEEIDRRVRAFWLMSRFTYRGKTVRVRRVRFDPTPVDAEPGTVLTASPPVRIATGRGTLIVEQAYSAGAFPWRWPTPWHKPKRGEKAY